MQNPLSTARSSFFDDDDLRVVFEFQKPDKTNQKDLNTPAILSNTLLRQVTPNGSFQQGHYALHNRTLAYYKVSTNKQPDIVLNLAHARLTPLTPISNPSTYGFSVVKNGVKHEFYSQEEAVITNWVNILKSICVMTNFHEEYKALKMIGKGSFAKVYLVESKTNGKSFAVKAFTKESVIASNKTNAKPSMLNEIDIMRILDHDNVIKLYEVYETEKSIYLVLELIQGKSLQEVLKKGGFKDNEARTINVISSIIEALAYLAANGIMHRDLKPDNILLDKGDKVKIADFGLATFIDVPEYIFKKCGTPGYIAPEVFKYDQKLPATNYDDRCDVFSAGCILHYMTLGFAFFDGHNASEILRANRKFLADYQSITNIKTEIKNVNSKLPKEALNLLLQLLEFDNKKRPSASQALTHPYLSSSVQQKPSFYENYQSGNCSPVVFDKRGSFAQELHLLQLKKEASTNSNQARFAEKDSLYLDLGKPELTGKIDTLTSGSANNSLLLQRADSIGSPKSASPFAKNSAQASTFRAQAAANGGNQQSFLKAAIFRNMAKNNEDEDFKDESPLIKKSPEGKHERRHSDFVTTKQTNFPPKEHNSDKGQSSESEDTDDVSQENPELQWNLEKMKMGVGNKHPSKLSESPIKRYSANYQNQKLYEKGF